MAHFILQQINLTGTMNLENAQTLYLIKGFGVSPVVTLCILKNAGDANLDAVAGQLFS